VLQDSTVFLAVAATLFGLVLGSFLNVVIYRVPRHESIVWPGSRCPSCGHEIRWYDNLPLVGWALLRGRCRDCGDPISRRYPLVEGVTGILFLAAFLVYGLQARLLLTWAFLAVLVVITFIDIDFFIIPDTIVLPAAAVGLAASIALAPHHWWEYVVAAFGAAAFLLLLALIWAGGMGMGDVKMALLMGAVLGRYVVVALFLAFLVGGIVGIGLMVAKLKKRTDRIPFGPYLAAGSAIAALWGANILNGYLKVFQR
jgi:leader peptidase (prepilin peptidase)/N-methyltransferase